MVHWLIDLKADGIVNEVQNSVIFLWFCRIIVNKVIDVGQLI